ncbi:hypothetical protein GUITHDRAFT_103298 [Guillardia theta CCMP2712]|uniref:Uncharacterized protein n=1 Tax=Guillardia theta (strain CCMP2712) TaxID=905079 RepID=L1JQG7_GUITC|nr:hypothetical protein GUITHDRAFT_103298 [Guillardia theta CCMP2712]EKX50707.1 hypothetical protein GUITHDRAFT_103298 [Guillardia theta CCMP2712]|eukprot:XP_005837687.1 hypothetical protein GUITHDRAFT_103298 [Guillardia theta CCMP2712]
MVPFNNVRRKVVACLLAATLSCVYLILLASLSARRSALSESPGSTLPAQIQKNIDGMWSKSLSAQHSSSSRSKGSSLPSSVLNGPGHQWEHDPYFVTEMGLDDGSSNLASDFGRMMRRMTVRRQWHWDKAGEVTGQPGFIQSGKVPPQVPIFGNA